MATEQVRVRKDLPSGTITIDNPTRHNALTPEMVRQLQQAFEDLQAEKRVRGVILTGTGKAFCSGTDLNLVHQQIDDPESIHQWQEEVQELLWLVEMMLRFPKPIIAAVDGVVCGTGAALMLASDLVIASHQSTVSLPEVTRGLVPGLAAPLLKFRAGTATAVKLVLSGARVTADQAIKWGFIHELVESDLIWARSHEMIGQLASAAPSSHQLAKQLINETIGEELFTHLSIGAANMAAARSTHAAKTGIAAFLEKKPVAWD